MTQHNETNSDTWLREELLHLLSVSATLSGLCVTIVALMNTFGRNASAATIGDDIFAVCALIFLVCIYLIFSALRTRKIGVLRQLVKLVDTFFMIGLTAMTLAAFIMVYTVL
jgi:hypothetical protein